MEGERHLLPTEIAAMLSASRLVEMRPERNGWWRVVPTGLVGAVRVGDVQVEVWPKEKVELTHLMFMLGYASNPGFLPTDVAAEQYDELWPALAESLARQAERALLHGVLQGYQTVDESSMVVRGRIRVGDQLRRQTGLPFPLEITYDEYLTDIAENRILRTALRRMQAVPRIPADVKARLSHLDNRLTGVGILRAGVARPPWMATRLNSRYHAALRLSEIILANASAQAGPGSTNVAAFVVSMWKVFEDFVTTALRESLSRRGERSEMQYPAFLDEPRLDGRARVKMNVDLVHFAGRRPATVFDAKYKALNSSSSSPNADQYQMFAYCTALEVKRAVLVYAGKAQPITRRVAFTDIDVTEHPLDLSQTPAEMLGALDLLAASFTSA
ncbi:McrC family protein [Homoserinimonas sp. OAct 916]|uniref:McrC family protein n=1 Tax=Homoserinimonas sp. OAct 916 TaxID=2211450 RepID=UPI000DBE6E12|nr:restriction endonuclease [Homoserinimonas sp. OAct 916]